MAIKTALDPLQVAIDNRLTYDAAITAKGVGVYDFVPEGSNLPYIEYGDDTVNDFSTKTWDGEEITHTLHIWSESKGKQETKQIIDLVLQSLTKSPLVLTGGFVVEDCRRDYMEVLGPDAGGIYHGILRMRFKIKQ